MKPGKPKTPELQIPMVPCDRAGTSPSDRICDVYVVEVSDAGRSQRCGLHCGRRPKPSTTVDIIEFLKREPHYGRTRERATQSASRACSRIGGVAIQ